MQKIKKDGLTSIRSFQYNVECFAKIVLFCPYIFLIEVSWFGSEFKPHDADVIELDWLKLQNCKYKVLFQKEFFFILRQYEI